MKKDQDRSRQMKIDQGRKRQRKMDYFLRLLKIEKRYTDRKKQIQPGTKTGKDEQKIERQTDKDRQASR